MILYSGRSHAAQAATEVVLDHHCPHCRAVSQGIALGRGSGSSGGFDASSSEATAHAQQNSQIDAARAMKLVRCPKCNRRDAAEVRGFFIRSLLVGVALGALLGVVTFMFTFAAGPLLAAGAAASGLGVGLGRFWWKLTQSDRVVHFDPGAR